MGLNLALGEDEESQWIPEVWNSKYKNGFFTMNCLDQDIFGSIFGFEIGWAETKIMQFAIREILR